MWWQVKKEKQAEKHKQGPAMAHHGRGPAMPPGPGGAPPAKMQRTGH